MKHVSATEAARRFSDLLDAVEHDAESFVVVRRGRAIARLTPAPAVTGADVKRLLLVTRPDTAWRDDLDATRSAVGIEERPWTG